MTARPIPGGACWWTLSAEALLEAMTRAHNGEDPEMLYIELFANSDSEDIDAAELPDEGPA